MNKKVAQYINSIKGKNIHIVGTSGAEGAAIINFLYKNGIKTITAHDFQPDLPSFRKRFKQTNSTLTPKQRAKILKNIINNDIKLHLKDSYLENILDADLIFLTSAWYIYPPNFPKIQQAIDKKIAISGLTKLYFDLAPCPIIGITGSQGKSTVTTLVTKLMQNSGKKIYVGGNIRDIYDQLLEKIDQIKKDNYIILEISNRQLTIDLQTSPHIATITNIYPNHIEEHGSYHKYKQIKESILKHQTHKDFAILNYDNPITKKLSLKYPSQKILFSTRYLSHGPHIENDQIIYKSKPLINLNEIKLIGNHNLSNILTALATIQPLNLSAKKIVQTLKKFTGIPHRLQKVAVIKQVTYIDDLKSSTPTSTLVALKAILTNFPTKLFPTNAPPTIHLIIGGNHKNVSYEKLARYVNHKNIIIHTLTGTASDELLAELKEINSKNQIIKHHNIFSCIENIHINSKPDDTVLLSPAGAEFQQLHLANKYSLKSLIKK